MSACEPLASLTYKPDRAIRPIAGECREPAQRTNETSGHDEIRIRTPLKTAVTEGALLRISTLYHAEIIPLRLMVYVEKLSG